MRTTTLCWLLMASTCLALGCDGATVDPDDAGVAEDSGPTPPGAMCGDGVCEGPEDCSTCAEDCGACMPATCGDGVCAPTETCDACAEDCGACAAGRDLVGMYVPLNTYAVLKLDDDAAGPERRFHLGPGLPGRGQAYVIAGDFDGDGRDTLGYYATATARFHLGDSNEGSQPLTELRWAPITRPADRTACGVAGGEGVSAARILPVAGDFDGDGVDDVGLADTSTGTFYLRDASGGERTVTFGPTCGLPIAGHFAAGGGTDGVGVFEPATGTFHLLPDLDDHSTHLTFVFDPVTDAQPVIGDWDGDGIDTVGVYDYGATIGAPNRFLLRNANTAGEPDLTITLDDEAHTFLEDRVGSVPLAGDWDLTGERGMGTGYAWDENSTSPYFDQARHARLDAAADGLGHLYSLLVASHGELVFEEYYRGQDASQGHNIKSVSKSVLSALFGIALFEGHFGYTGGNPMQHLETLFLDEQLGYTGAAGTGYGELRGDSPSGNRRVSLYDVLTMSAGFAWNENAATPPNVGSLVGSTDWVGHVVSQPMRDLGRFTYSTGLTHVGSRLLTDQTGVSTAEYAERALFEPLGISGAAVRWDYEPNLDSEGEPGPNNGGWQVWMRPRDMARFGELYLRGGTIDGVEIVPQDWIANPAEPDSRYYTTHAAFPATGACGGADAYGGWWWPTALSSDGNGVFRGYMAVGFGGQLIVIIPEDELVVVVTSRIFGVSGCNHIGAEVRLLREEILPAIIRTGGAGG